MRSKKILFLFLLLGFIIKSQTFLNGDFENNSASICRWNLSNTSFNGYMNDCYGFGTASELDIYKKCGFGSAQNGSWFIALHSIVSSSDRFSMKMNNNLIIGNKYSIRYYERSDTTFCSTRDSLIIGVSNDSLTFGTQIYSSLPITDTNWTQKTFTFTASINCHFVTVGNKGVAQGYNYVDNFQFIPYNGILEIDPENRDLIVYPNPTNGFLSIKGKAIKEIKVYDLQGREIVVSTNKEEDKLILNFAELEQGIYFIKINSERSIKFRKVEKVIP